MSRHHTRPGVEYQHHMLANLSLHTGKKLLIAAICLSSFIAPSGFTQNSSSGIKTDQAGKSCDGQTAEQKLRGSGSDAAMGMEESKDSDGSQSESASTQNHLKLSMDASSSESSDPEGQFCKRERPGQKSQPPSASSPQPEGAIQSSPSTPPAPIAELKDGALFIQANGQDFVTVIEAIRSATGMAVEMPAESQPEPVFLKMGPTSTRDALVALIGGSKYNYIIVGSERDPELVKRLILSEPAARGASTLVASTAQSPAAAEPTLYGGQGMKVDSEAEVAEPQPPPPPAPPPIQPTAIPSSVPTGINIQQLAAQSGKTTGQILGELQKRQQQMLDEQAAQQPQQ